MYASEVKQGEICIHTSKAHEPCESMASSRVEVGLPRDRSVTLTNLNFSVLAQRRLLRSLGTSDHIS